MLETAAKLRKVWK